MSKTKGFWHDYPAGWRPVWLIFVLVFALGATCHQRTIPSQSVPQCPDIPDSILNQPLSEDWEFWFQYTYEPFCDGLDRASRA